MSAEAPVPPRERKKDGAVLFGAVYFPRLDAETHMHASNLCEKFGEELLGKESVSTETLVPVACMVRMFLACDFRLDDVARVMAVALGNAAKMGEILQTMGVRERVMVSIMHLFIAHSLVVDEFVPMQHWHAWIFRSYCTPGCLDRGVFKLMSLLKFRLLVQGDDFEKYHRRFREELEGESLTSEGESTSETSEGDSLSSEGESLVAPGSLSSEGESLSSEGESL